MNTTTTIQQIIDIINDMNEAELIQLNNEYCEAINDMDSQIFDNDEDFFSNFFANDTIGAVRAVSYGSYNYSANYVKFNGYGNLESFSYVDTDTLCENVETMAEYIADNLHEFTQFDNVEENEEEEKKQADEDYNSALEQDFQRYENSKK